MQEGKLSVPIQSYTPLISSLMSSVRGVHECRSAGFGCGSQNIMMYDHLHTFFSLVLRAEHTILMANMLRNGPNLHFWETMGNSKTKLFGGAAPFLPEFFSQAQI